MVAAWIRADTGVGPAIASGSQVCKGSCADLPTAPPSSSKVIAVIAGPPSTKCRCASSDCLLNVERAEVAKQPEEADRHQGVAHPGDDEGLARRRAIGGILVPEADQEVAAQADPFPAEEQEQQVVAQNQEQHAGDKQIHVREEARAVAILPHVPGGEYVDEEADARDDTAAS